MATGCISFDSYIKPQPVLDYAHIGIVVYLLTPTSNHNFDTICSLSAELYIFWLLHQTTTKRGCACRFQRCISFDSYIKPQHSGLPQNAMGVVYLLTPTSNHNTLMSPPLCKQLYIFWLLHQTTTADRVTVFGCALYIFWLLHQTTTYKECSCKVHCCISFDSYIKPQPVPCNTAESPVVYLLTPTSNHNYSIAVTHNAMLYIFWLLHQTTTYRFKNTDFQRITFTFSNKKWWVGYIFQCKSTKKTPIE